MTKTDVRIVKILGIIILLDGLLSIIYARNTHTLLLDVGRVARMIIGILLINIDEIK